MRLLALKIGAAALLRWVLCNEVLLIVAANQMTALRQHINFYTALDRKQEPLLSARQIALALLAVSVLMALPYAVVYFSYTETDKELTALRQEHGQIKKQLDAANKTRDSLLKDTRYAVQIEKAQRELSFKQRVLSKVSRPENRSFNGFAQYLLGLARQHIQGMWLTGISLQKAGDDVIAREVTATRALFAAETGTHRMLNELFVSGSSCATPSWSVWDFDADSGTGVGLDNCQVSVSCTELTPDRGGTFYDIEAEGQCGYGAETDDSAVRIVRMQAKL